MREFSLENFCHMKFEIIFGNLFRLGANEVALLVTIVDYLNTSTLDSFYWFDDKIGGKLGEVQFFQFLMVLNNAKYLSSRQLAFLQNFLGKDLIISNASR